MSVETSKTTNNVEYIKPKPSETHISDSYIRIVDSLHHDSILLNRKDDYMDNRSTDFKSDSDNYATSRRELEYQSSSNEQEVQKSMFHVFADETEKDKLNINVFRFKFTQEIMDALFEFSKIHQYDGRKIFKESWSIWCDENEDLIQREKQRLRDLGYDGEVEDKMYKSARYYFRKKGTEKMAPKVRRNYIGMSRDMLEAMDQHIYMGLMNDNFKPADGFDDFCAGHKELLKIEIEKMVSSGLTALKDVQMKVKKTYKNRYFLVVKDKN